jgi:hypothetical protein
MKLLFRKYWFKMKNTVKINGAEAILLSLIKENVNTIFGYPGMAVDEIILEP